MKISLGAVGVLTMLMACGPAPQDLCRSITKSMCHMQSCGTDGTFKTGYDETGCQAAQLSGGGLLNCLHADYDANPCGTPGVYHADRAQACDAAYKAFTCTAFLSGPGPSECNDICTF